MSDAEVVVVERTAHSLDALLAPRSVALVGASNRKASSGNEMVLAALSGRPPDGAPGVRIYAVNPAYAEVEGLRCLPSLADLPETVEHVVISVGNARLEAVFAEVVAHGAKAATIFGSGHLEDDTPPSLKGRILAMAREAGIRLCGPNCMGFSNLSLGLHVAAFPFPKDLQPGPIAWIAQSGSVYGALAYNDRRMRFALCASTGAEWDVTAADYLDWSLSQPEVRVVGMFLEAVRDPAGFTRALERAAERCVPVVILKSGRTEAAASMARTHTGAVAGDDAAYAALFERHGVTRVYGVEELAAAMLMFSQPRRAGPGGMVSIHDSGGECELLIDLAAEVGVPITAITETTRTTLRANLDPGLAPVNPCDAWGTGRDAVRIFENCFRALLDDPAAAVGVLCSDLRDGNWHADNMVEVARRVHAASSKPVVIATNHNMLRNEQQVAKATAAGVRVIEGTRPALQAVRHLLAYRDFQAREPDPPPAGPWSAVVTHWRDRLAAGPLDESESLALLADWGIPVPARQIVESRTAAIAAARDIGHPVALKTAMPGIEHKSERGGVRLGLADDQAVGTGFDDLAARLGPRVLVAAMAPRGVEMGLGVIRDPQFGPFVMVAAGGVLIELLADSAVSLAPFGERTASRLVDSLRARRLLAGVRGAAPADTAALAATLARLSVLAADLDGTLQQLDVNPVIVGADGCMAVDALVVGATR